MATPCILKETKKMNDLQATKINWDKVLELQVKILKVHKTMHYLVFSSFQTKMFHWSKSCIVKDLLPTGLTCLVWYLKTGQLNKLASISVYIT